VEELPTLLYVFLLEEGNERRDIHAPSTLFTYEYVHLWQPKPCMREGVNHQADRQMISGPKITVAIFRLFKKWSND
jgi:hypothetical protein